MYYFFILYIDQIYCLKIEFFNFGHLLKEVHFVFRYLFFLHLRLCSDAKMSFTQIIRRGSFHRFCGIKLNNFRNLEFGKEFFVTIILTILMGEIRTLSCLHNTVK